MLVLPVKDHLSAKSDLRIHEWYYITRARNGDAPRRYLIARNARALRMSSVLRMTLTMDDRTFLQAVVRKCSFFIGIN